MFLVITPLKRNAHSKNVCFLSCQIIELEYVYMNL